MSPSCGACPQGCGAAPGLRVALIGQPNSGKSTLFNAVAGYRSATANFPGATVGLTSSRVRVNGSQLQLIDVPGIYSLSASTPAEKTAKTFLLSRKVDVIVNVVDASVMSRSLELTLELRELGIPSVVCLNMMDEAARKGMAISPAKLSELLGLPVVEAVASRGTGVQELFARVVRQANRPPETADALGWHRDVEAVVDRLERRLMALDRAPAPARFTAVKLLEGDPDVGASASGETQSLAERMRRQLARTHGRSAESVIMSERHDRAMDLAEQSVTLGRPHPDLRAGLDRMVTHPVWGYLILVLVLAGLFGAVFGLGGWLERGLLRACDAAFQPVAARLSPETTVSTLVRSVWGGLTGGAAVLLPYVVPFLFGLALLEDVGYLPRVAYLLDGLLHRIGLHGTSVVPIVLGYGCSVPACLATRVLPSRRDRFLAIVLATLVPCSARSTVIFALAAFYLGPAWGLAIFLVNGLAAIGSGWLLARIWPEVSIGMIMEVPKYQIPSVRIALRKVWLRLREFILVSWPLLVGGSVVLGFAELWHWDRFINIGLRPLTAVLGLPPSLGVTLIFGILRKELSILMLTQALGTSDVHTVLSPAQLLTFTVFVTFYIPCLATLGTMANEIGRKLTVAAAGYSLVLATGLGAATHFLLDR